MRIVAIVLLGLALLAGGARAQQAGAGWLGVELKDLTKAEADALGWEAPRGAKLVKPVPGGPAEAQGLKPDDILVSLDGVEIESVKALVETVAQEGGGHGDQTRHPAGRAREAARPQARRAAGAVRGGEACGGCAAADARHRRAYGDDPEHRVYAGRQAARLGLRRQDHPRVGSGERQDRAHDQGRERAGRCGQGLRHGAVAGRQMAGGGGVDCIRNAGERCGSISASTSSRAASSWRC